LNYDNAEFVIAVWAVGDASPYKIIQIRPRQGTPQFRITNYELRIKTERMLL